MTESGARPGRRAVWRVLLIAVGAGFLLMGLAAWYATTESFQSMVRRRVVSDLERVTGGRVELGGIHTVPFHFQIEARDLTIHGNEPANQTPYVHVDSLVARVKLISVVSAELGFRSVELEHPVIHIISYADGSTNQPEPGRVSGTTPVERLFSLSIDSLAVRRGQLLWNEQIIPLDFAVQDISADLDYSLLHRRYDGNLLLGKAETSLKDFRPLAWMAEAHFSLGHNLLEIKSLKATSGRSRLEAKGEIKDFRTPRIEADYTLNLDLAEAGAVARHSELRRGIVQFEGNGSWSAQGGSSTGKLSVTGLDWHDEIATLQNGNGVSQFSVSGQRLVLSQIQVRMLGGSITGDAEVSNWLNFAPVIKGAKAKPADLQKGRVRLRMKDMQAAEIALALSSPQRPFNRINLAGVASGTLEVRWNGSPRNAETEIAVDVAAPSQPRPGQFPLNAHGNATYRFAAGELDVTAFNASTRATQVRASGTLSTHTAMKLSVNTSDLAEWQPVLAAIGYDESMPASFHGHAAFTGNATGNLSEMTISGKLQSQGLDLHIPGNSQRPEKDVHWDSFAADIQLSPNGVAAHNGTVRQANADISFDASAGLQERKFTDTSSFSARVEMHNADAAKVLDLAGYSYPVTGSMDLSVQASGTTAAPMGQGEIKLLNATVFGRRVQRLESKLSFSGKQVSLTELRVSQRDAQVTGSGEYNASTHAYRFDLDGSNFDLALVPQLQQTRLSVQGRVDFQAQSWGTLEAPILNASVVLRDLGFDHQRAGNFTFGAVTEGSDLRLTGRSEFKDAELNLDGNVHLRGDWLSAISLHFDHLDATPLLRAYLREAVTGQALAGGDIQVNGPLRNPRELTIAGSLTDLQANLEHIQIRNNGPALFTISSRSLTIQQLRFVGQDTDLSVNGSVRLSGEGLDMHAHGRADLQLIHSLNPDFNTSGAVAVDVAASGTLFKPAMQGRLDISNGAIAYADLPSALTAVNGSLIFTRDRLQVEALTAHVGGGSVTLEGYANIYNRQLNFNLGLRAQDVRLRYPPGVSSISNADLRFAGTSAASTLSGDIRVDRLAVTPGFDFGAYMRSTAQASVLPRADPILSRLRLDVHITTNPELRMQTAVVRLSGDADLRLRGTASKPVLLGRADILEGQVNVNGAKYRMERGDITFNNPVTTTAVLDLQASTRVQDYDVSINLNGALDKLNMSFHSEPPLPTADIINLLALGQTQLQSAQMQQSSQTPFTQEASSAILAQALNTTVSNRTQRLFGFSHIKIDPQGLTTETTPTQTTPAVTIEQQVRDNLTVAFTTNVAQTSQQIIQGEYYITRDVSVRGIRDYNGVVSFEVIMRRRRR